jgi:hypothetical protein
MRKPHIEVGDYYLIYTKNGAEYDNAYVLGISEDSILIECNNEVKDRIDEFEIRLNDILCMFGFNDSQTTVQHPSGRLKTSTKKRRNK